MVTMPPTNVVIDAAIPALYCSHSMAPELGSGKNPEASVTMSMDALEFAFTVNTPLLPAMPA